ncbi:MAG: TetR/AcrR family transcriptional regulator [Sedimentisphaerales bacterium]|nr:TetR/AcrR family transcriptional regulator [Sedimentisphaerales bacterium]
MVVLKGKKMDGNSNKKVKDRLLDSAEELFCEHGFDSVSVRDIAASADCNVASINYYFGGKEKLYHEVWLRYLLTMRDIRITSINEVMSQNEGKPRLEDLLRAFSESFIGPLVDENKARRFCKLMAREMIDQHVPISMFVENIMTPTLIAMRDALIKICPGFDESKVSLVITSIVGQLMHMLHIKAILKEYGKTSLPNFDLAQAIEHVVKFSIEGMGAYIEGKSK